MIAFFRKLSLIFKYGDELETLLQNIRKEQRKKEREAKRHHLKLCIKHQQEQYRSHYSEHNCDYCKLLVKVEKKEGNEI